jgi:hypothetical protein
MIDNKKKRDLERSIRNWMIFFIISLVFSGITAFAIETELQWICSWWPDKDAVFYQWLAKCYEGIRQTNNDHPFLAYGYDWLAFSHIVIAVFFVGPLRDPVRNSWIIQSGCIACVLILPLAFVAGAVRQIPVYWQLIDCSFGIIGLIPLTICLHKIKQLEKLAS